MTKKIKRTEDFELVLEIKTDDFIRPPRDAQRNAILNNALNELSDNLHALDKLALRFVPGKSQIGLEDRTQKILSDDEIMEEWQIPLMQAMAEIVTESNGNILEIGFGRGISATMIQEQQVLSHTIIECNDSVVDRFFEWKELFKDRKINLVHGLWQDTIDELGLFDGIFFHTYPLNEEEYMKNIHGKSTFAEHFFETAANHMHPKGVFTYFSNEIDSLSRGHQRALLQHFSYFSVKVIPLEIPDDINDTWWADSMVIVKAVK
ncbi:class I SAM-dependent methyltransferase [Flavisolibacter sp. BT320]|nr:class I SAM-dependent methyltransferase [Flavisolibacter longurius]